METAAKIKPTQNVILAASAIVTGLFSFIHTKSIQAAIQHLEVLILAVLSVRVARSQKIGAARSVATALLTFLTGFLAIKAAEKAFMGADLRTRSGWAAFSVKDMARELPTAIITLIITAATMLSFGYFGSAKLKGARRVVLAGPRGAGKTRLFVLLSGEENKAPEDSEKETRTLPTLEEHSKELPQGVLLVDMPGTKEGVPECVLPLSSSDTLLYVYNKQPAKLPDDLPCRVVRIFTGGEAPEKRCECAFKMVDGHIPQKAAEIIRKELQMDGSQKR